MSDAPIVTTGVPPSSGPDGPVPIRREIRSLEKDFPDLWTLYVLGLKVFQEAPEKDPLSYYQIAGIHGRPYVPWNGVVGDQAAGYCTHASILFPTWHRPYLALFEEVLYRIVQKKATEYPEAEGRARYVAAAKDFRMPYWDWAAVLPAGTTVFPASLATKTLNVVTPTSRGKPTPIENPLYSFKFHPLNPTPGDFVDPQIRSWSETVRWPKNGTTTSQNEKISTAIELLNNDRSSNLREKVFNLISSYSSYGPFSNKQWNQGNPGIYGSLEDVHDTIHVDVGGAGSTRRDSPGHMGLVPYAAFDPVFWLHHTNIDRFFAIWQALNPTSYVVPQPASEDTVTTQAGTEENIQTALTPFWETSDSFWTSDGVRKTGAFGYAYPETQEWKFSTPQQYQSNVRTVFRQLYGGSSLGTIIAESSPGHLTNKARLNIPLKASVNLASKAPAVPTASAAAESISSLATKATESVKQVFGGDQKPLVGDESKHGDSKAQHTPEDKPKVEGKPVDNPKAAASHQANPKAEPKHDDPHKKRDITDLAHNGKYLEWITNLKVEKHFLEGTFTVHVFLGEFDRDDPASWLSTENKVGSFNVLGDVEDTGCGKCKNDRDRRLQVTGQVPLTLALAERYLAGQLDGLTPEAVIPFLQTHLHWRVTLGDGSEYPRGRIPSLKISIISNEATVPTAHDQLPQYADDVTLHPEATTDRNGDGRGEGTGLTDVGQA